MILNRGTVLKMILCMVASMIVSSCVTVSSRKVMDRAETIMSEKPDSALMELETIDGTRLHRRDRARYSLLYSMALDKNFVDTADVSVVMPAVNYYYKHGTADNKMKAFYYLGRVYENAGDGKSSINAFSKAFEFSDDTKDMRARGMLYRSISGLYMKDYSYDEAEPYALSAYKCFKQVSDTSMTLLCAYRIALVYTGQNRYNEADSIYVRLMEERHFPIGFRNAMLCDYAILNALKAIPDYDKAYQLFSDLIDSGYALDSYNATGAYAFVSYGKGLKAQSDAAISSISRIYEAKPAYYHWKERIMREQGDYLRAYNYLDSSLTFQKQLVNEQLKQSTIKARKEYFEMSNQVYRKEIQYRRIHGLVFILIILVLSGAIASVSIAKKKKMEEDQLLIDSVRRLWMGSNTRLKEKEESLDYYKKEYLKLYRSQMACLEDVFNVYELSMRKTDSDSELARRLRDVLGSMDVSKEEKSRFERKVDSYFDGIMSFFRMDFPGLPESDYRFMCFVFAGFDATTIMLIMDMPSLSSVHTKKSRLKKMITVSDVPEKSRYLDFISRH